jgi:hypothetical protein
MAHVVYALYSRIDLGLVSLNKEWWESFQIGIEIYMISGIERIWEWGTGYTAILVSILFIQAVVE